VAPDLMNSSFVASCFLKENTFISAPLSVTLENTTRC